MGLTVCDTIALAVAVISEWYNGTTLRRDITYASVLVDINCCKSCIVIQRS